MNGIKKQLMLQYRTLIGTLTVFFASAVAGDIICCLIMTLDKTVTAYCPFGSFMGMFIGCIVVFFINMYSYVNYFNLTLRCGGTRKSFLLGGTVTSILRILTVLLLPYLWRLVDMAIYNLFFSSFDRLELDIVTLPPLARIVIGLTLLILPAVLGLLIARFGKGMLIVVYFLFVFPGIFSSRIISALEDRDMTTLIGRVTVHIADMIAEAPVWGLGLCAGAIFCLLAGVGIFLVRRKEFTT